MRKSLPLRLAFITLVAGFSLTADAPRAQSQDATSPSVAEAARRAKRQKKKSDKPAVVVIDDDTLKPGPPAPATAPAPPPETPAVTPSGANGPAADVTAPPGPQPQSSSASTDESADKADKLKSLKKQLVDAEKDLELSQADLALQQDTYFSNPDYIHDKDGKAKVDAKQLDVTEKQQIVDKLKLKIALLEGPRNPSTASTP